MTIRTSSTRLGAAAAAAGLITLGLAVPASAHVSVSPSTTAAGAYTVLTFSVPHGCDGSATTSIDIAIPEGINAVTPTRNALYDVAKRSETLDPPVEDAHGNELTERVSVVTYTATTPLADGYRDTMELSLQLPDAEGETLAFPVIQTCTKGETAWTEVAAEGSEADEAELEHPAPLVTITATSGDAHHGGDSEDDEHGEDGEDGEAGAEATSAGAGATSGTDLEPVSASADDSGNGLAVAGLVAGVLGLLAGGAALARSGHRA